MKIVLLGSSIILTIVCIKYKPVYEVTLSGETIGFAMDKEKIETKINNYINDTTGNIAFREIKEMPEYEFKLVNRGKETKDKTIVAAIQDVTMTTYRTYAVISDGEEKVILASQEEAEKIIEETKTDLNKDVTLDLGITEVYTTEYNVANQEDAKNILNEIKVAKVQAVEAEKAKKAAEVKKAAMKKSNTSVAELPSTSGSGNIGSLALSKPVSGTISSRFGSRSSSRSSAHTGLDIAAAKGTGIRAIASGMVTYAGNKGSYGNLVIVDHGDGIQSYYAHCNEIYASVGQSVDSSTTIAAVGSTGNSTGSHLHLEIRINGKPMNPQNYLY